MHRPRRDIQVAEGVGERARARMKSGKRVVLQFTPTGSEFIPGMSAEESGA